MPDFERIDRELAALGSVPEAVQPLLDLYGQRDRSLETVDVVLEALKDGREPTSSPPEAATERPSFLPLGWDADRKSEPGVEATPALGLEREEITVTSGVPEAMEPAPVAVPSVIAEDPVIAEAPVITAEPDALQTSRDLEEDVSIDTQEASPPPPPDEPAYEPAAEAASDASPFQPADDLGERPIRRSSRPPRADLQALLDAELDPREFPSTTPPRLPRSSMPPGASLPPPLPSSAPAQDTDFELLVDDDDILEIDEEAE